MSPVSKVRKKKGRTLRKAPPKHPRPIVSPYQEAIEIVRGYASLVIETFTSSALLLNSIDITRKHYIARGDDFPGLNTTMYIPDQFRAYPVDVDVWIDAESVIEIYATPMVEHLASTYLIWIVSVYDAFFEDLYASLLRVDDPELSDSEVAKKSAEPWRGNNLRKFLTETIKLRAPTGNPITPDMVLNRYQEFREYRHALIHSRGQLTQKNLRQLQKLWDTMKHIPGWAHFPLITDGRVRLDHEALFFVRKFSIEVLPYLGDGLSITPRIRKEKRSRTATAS